jgi:two-component system LytT family sensor kinase
VTEAATAAPVSLTTMRGFTSALPTSGRTAPIWMILLAAAAASVVYATHLYLYHRLQREPASFPGELAEAAVHFGAWAVLVPVVLRLARRWPLLDRDWPRRLLLHLVVGLAVAVSQLALHTWLDRALIHGWAGLDAFLDDGRRFFARTYYANVCLYLAVVLGDSTLSWSRRRRAREAELERHLTQAQLDTLRQQLQPHFLFNALNTVSTLVAEDPAGAQRMIARLADLLRQALDERNATEMPLWRELELANSYLAIEQVRFGDRMIVSVDVPASVANALVPGLLLQPILENAVRHGLARRPGPSRIDIAACAHDGRLHVRVTDRTASPALRDVGRVSPDDPGKDTGTGIGLSNVRARLHHLYGDAQQVTLTAMPDGTAVEVRLPLRRAAHRPQQSPLPATGAR